MGNKKNKNKIGCPEVSKFKLSGLKGAEARWGRHNNPKGGGMARPMPKESKVKVSKVKNKQVYLPENLQTKEFETTWDNWQQYRKEKRASPERRCMMECEALNKANKRIEGLDKELHRWELQATNEAIANEQLQAELAKKSGLLKRWLKRNENLAEQVTKLQAENRNLYQSVREG